MYVNTLMFVQNSRIPTSWWCVQRSLSLSFWQKGMQAQSHPAPQPTVVPQSSCSKGITPGREPYIDTVSENLTHKRLRSIVRVVSDGISYRVQSYNQSLLLGTRDVQVGNSARIRSWVPFFLELYTLHRDMSL